MLSLAALPSKCAVQDGARSLVPRRLRSTESTLRRTKLLSDAAWEKHVQARWPLQELAYASGKPATCANQYQPPVPLLHLLASGFQPVNVPEPTNEETLTILKGLAKKYEAGNGAKQADRIGLLRELRRAIECCTVFPVVAMLFILTWAV